MPHLQLANGQCDVSYFSRHSKLSLWLLTYRVLNYAVKHWLSHWHQHKHSVNIILKCPVTKEPTQASSACSVLSFG